MGRPVIYEQPVAAVSIDGRGIAWGGGVFSGDPDLVEYARLAAKVKMRVKFGAVVITASDDDEAGAVAAMAASCPGRAFITTCSPEVAALVSGEPEVPGSMLEDTDVQV